MCRWLCCGGTGVGGVCCRRGIPRVQGEAEEFSLVHGLARAPLRTVPAGRCRRGLVALMGGGRGGVVTSRGGSGVVMVAWFRRTGGMGVSCRWCWRDGNARESREKARSKRGTRLVNGNRESEPKERMREPRESEIGTGNAISRRIS